MKSVGEVMAIGRTFEESLQKALRCMETGLSGLDDVAFEGLGAGDDKNVIRAELGRPTPDRILKVAQAMRLGVEHEQIHASCRIDPWFLARIQAIIDTERRVLAHGLPKSAPELPRSEGHGLLRCAPREACIAFRSRGAQPPARARRPSGLQAHRHLRGRVRLAHRLHVLHLRARPSCRRRAKRRAGLRGAAVRQEQDRHSRRRPEPHRPGHRVRLLLLPRLLRAERCGLRNDHDQLQPGDRVDRLRHLRPALLRAADRRGRAGDHRASSKRRARSRASSCSSAARRRSSSPSR